MSYEYLNNLKNKLAKEPRQLSVYIRTYGCQQNVSDSERIAGMLEEAGYKYITEPEDADLIIFNTCAVREHAENKVYGHIGNLKHVKEKKPGAIIAIGGCMVHQKQVADEIKARFPYVDILFSTNAIKELPDLIAERLSGRGVIDATQTEKAEIEEDFPVVRDKAYRAFIPIMYGCDNFCTYCIVPYVRGRERSRNPEMIEKEFREAVAAGHREIMLLGQNVNSYGKHLDGDMNFSKLLSRLAKIDGDFMIRFMTSHPKDASDELFRTIAENPKISRHIHLPVQSGSTRILKAMNRSYTAEQYIDLIGRARNIIPDVTFSSDIIVGFPGETEEDFEQTIELVKKVRYQSLFTFIYSKRSGTIAAKMDDPISHKEKTERFARLLKVQDDIATEFDKVYIGNTYRCLVTGVNDNGITEARMDNNAVVELDRPVEENTFANIHIIRSEHHRLFGEVRD